MLDVESSTCRFHISEWRWKGNCYSRWYSKFCQKWQQSSYVLLFHTDDLVRLFSTNTFQTSFYFQGNPWGFVMTDILPSWLYTPDSSSNNKVWIPDTSNLFPNDSRISDFSKGIASQGIVPKYSSKSRALRSKLQNTTSKSFPASFNWRYTCRSLGVNIRQGGHQCALHPYITWFATYEK